jgi:tRNA (Thr-GGU) A37 N-methylase
MDSFTGQVLFAASVLIGSLSVRTNLLDASYWDERRGRLRVETEMKNIANVRLKTSEGFFVQPIAEVHSCFRQCLGTPRQGLLVPSARATISLHRNMSPEALDGLEEFSHVWLTFQFHLNGNSLKQARAFEGAEVVELDENGEVLKKNTNKFTFIAKITPPMLKEKKGVLATRSPHRPNPIGVTLAKIEAVDKKNRCLVVSACDLVEGTPILDIKPYVPDYDNVEPYRVPTWIAETIDTRNEVIVSEKAREGAKRIQKKLRQFKNDSELFLKALTETLEADVRSKFQTKKRIDDSSKGIVVEVPFDEAMVLFFWKKETVIEVEDIVLARNFRKEEKEMLGIKIESDEIEDKGDNGDEDN